MSARIFTLALAALLTASAAAAQAQKAAKLQWGPAPPFLPADARFAVVSGDPGKPGPFAIQLHARPTCRSCIEHEDRLTL